MTLLEKKSCPVKAIQCPRRRNARPDYTVLFTSAITAVFAISILLFQPDRTSAATCSLAYKECDDDDTGYCAQTAKSCTVSGPFSDSTTQTSISNLQNALGITVSAQAMGTFTGTTIADEANVKGRCCQASHLSRLRGLEGTRALIATQNLSLTTEC